MARGGCESEVRSYVVVCALAVLSQLTASAPDLAESDLGLEPTLPHHRGLTLLDCKGKCLEMDRNEKMLPASLHSGDPGDQCSKQCCGPERSQKKIIIIILKKKAKDQMFSCPEKIKIK